MRLINADKLANKSCPMGKRKYCCNCGEKRTIKNPYTNQSISCDDIRFDFLQMIDREKTVKAIAVEWIERFMNRFSTSEGVSGDEYALLHYMLTEWEKENEID